MRTIVTRYPVVAVALPVAMVIGLSTWLGQGSLIGSGASAAIVIGYALVVTVAGRRGETLATLAGRPRDERSEHINREASVWALGVSAIVVLAAFAIATASGGEAWPFALIGSVIAVAYGGSLVLVRARH